MTPQSEKMKLVEAQMAELPPIVRAAIDSAQIPEHLRKLNETHSLHVDQWATLQDIVMMSVVGLEDVSQIPERIRTELRLEPDAVLALALDINEMVFEPIREELERGLGSPQAKEVEVSPIESIRQETLAHAKASGALAPVAATPAAPKPTDKAARAVLSTSYAPAQPSHERKAIDGDPYREQVG